MLCNISMDGLMNIYKYVLFVYVGVFSQTRKENCKFQQSFSNVLIFLIRNPIKICSLYFVFPQADRNIPNSTNVSVEVTPPMNGVAEVDEVQLPSNLTQGYVTLSTCLHVVNVNPPQAVEEDEDEDQPLSLAWPDSFRKQIIYLLILPIVFPLWLSLPDVRREVTAHTRSICKCITKHFWHVGVDILPC